MLPYKNKVAVAAHRGNSKYFPENTLAAMKSALSLPVDMLETIVDRELWPIPTYGELLYEL